MFQLLDLIPPHLSAGVEDRLRSVMHDVGWLPLKIALSEQKLPYKLKSCQVRSTVLIAANLHSAYTEDTSHVGSANNQKREGLTNNDLVSVVQQKNRRRVRGSESVDLTDEVG